MNASYLSHLSAITYQSVGQQWIFVFAVTDLGNLVADFWDGSQWQWIEWDQRLSAWSHMSAITYPSGGQQQIYVFGEEDNGHLVVNYCRASCGNGSNWLWANQGLPPGGATQVTYPSAITYPSGGKQLIYVFAVANNNHLVVNYLDGSKWQWADQGTM